MNDLHIGQLITTEQQRDAVHMAIIPATAGERLAPGERVGVDENGRAYAYAEAIGIVDPFLLGNVCQGKKFWLFLFPGSITSLRHDWSHPSFPGTQAAALSEAVREVSRVWLVSYANRLGVTLEELINGAINGGCISTDINYPSDVPDAFWGHYKTYTGRDVSDRWEYFSCSC